MSGFRTIRDWLQQIWWKLLAAFPEATLAPHPCYQKSGSAKSSHAPWGKVSPYLMLIFCHHLASAQSGHLSSSCRTLRNTSETPSTSANSGGFLQATSVVRTKRLSQTHMVPVSWAEVQKLFLRSLFDTCSSWGMWHIVGPEEMVSSCTRGGLGCILGEISSLHILWHEKMLPPKRPIPLLPGSFLPQPTYLPGGYNFILYTSL